VIVTIISSLAREVRQVRDHHPFNAGDPGHYKKDCFILKYICVVYRSLFHLSFHIKFGKKNDLMFLGIFFKKSITVF